MALHGALAGTALGRRWESVALEGHDGTYGLIKQTKVPAPQLQIVGHRVGMIFVRVDGVLAAWRL